MTTQWIYKCGNDWKYCRDGFCQRYLEFKEMGVHEADAMSKEWKKHTGIDWNHRAISKQFERLTATKRRSNKTHDFGGLKKRVGNLLKYIDRLPPARSGHLQGKINYLKTALEGVCNENDQHG